MLLSAIIDNYHGGPVGVETLAALIADERSTIEDFLRTIHVTNWAFRANPRGRKATHKAYKHLGKTPKKDLSQRSLL